MQTIFFASSKMHKMKVPTPIITTLLSLFSYLCVPSLGAHFGEPSSIRVCLTPPNTLKKVQTHIGECQHEVNAHIFNEAYSLLHEHGFPHIVHDHGDEPFFNFTESDQAILDLVSQSHHSSSHHSAHSDHHHSELHHSIHSDDHHHSIHSGDHHHDSLLHHPPHHHHSSLHTVLPPSRPKFHYTDPFDTNGHSFGWDNIVNKKADSAQAKPETDDELLKPAETKNAYTFFNLPGKVRRKRHSWDETVPDINIHPTVVTFKEKRIAGCLMNCLYQKNHVIDKSGWPSLDGLVNFYSDGVHEHGFFMTVLRASDYCLKGASIKYHISRHSPATMDLSCDVAFDLFDCVSDKITEYCSQHHYHPPPAPPTHHGHGFSSFFHGRK